ncbi:MAG TPA: four helix bundle protein [Lentimicrobium sp.]|nr:four helix bundle protein [Lentimicrobium sp.]
MATIKSFRELPVFSKSYKLSMQVFELTSQFPKEERYSLIDQIRRSSRSISANISEAWAKKIYEKHFVSKLSDALGEEYETEVWLNYALDCKYLKEEHFTELITSYSEVRKMLIYMINNSEIFCKKFSN